MLCPQCGASGLPNDAAFCPECGHALAAEAGATSGTKPGVSTGAKILAGLVAAGVIGGGTFAATRLLASKPDPAPAALAGLPFPTSTPTPTTDSSYDGLAAPAPTSSGNSSDGGAAEYPEPVVTRTVGDSQEAIEQKFQELHAARKKENNSSSTSKTVTLRGFTFELPPGWSAEEKYDRFQPEDSREVQLYGPRGTDDLRGYITLHPGTQEKYAPYRGTCTDPTYYETVDVENVPQFPSAPGAQDTSPTLEGKVFPRFVYRIVEDPVPAMGTGHRVGQWAASLSLTDHPAGEGNRTCELNEGTGLDIPGVGVLKANVGGERQFGGRATTNTGPLVYDSKQAALDYMDTEEYKAAKRMLTSLQVSPTP